MQDALDALQRTFPAEHTGLLTASGRLDVGALRHKLVGAGVLHVSASNHAAALAAWMEHLQQQQQQQTQAQQLQQTQMPMDVDAAEEDEADAAAAAAAGDAGEDDEDQDLLDDDDAHPTASPHETRERRMLVQALVPVLARAARVLDPPPPEEEEEEEEEPSLREQQDAEYLAGLIYDCARVHPRGDTAVALVLQELRASGAMHDTDEVFVGPVVHELVQGTRRRLALRNKRAREGAAAAAPPPNGENDHRNGGSSSSSGAKRARHG